MYQNISNERPICILDNNKNYFLCSESQFNQIDSAEPEAGSIFCYLTNSIIVKTSSIESSVKKGGGNAFGFINATFGKNYFIENSIVDSRSYNIAESLFNGDIRFKSVNHSYINSGHCATYVLNNASTAEITFCQSCHINSVNFISWHNVRNYAMKNSIYRNLTMNYDKDDYRGIIYTTGNSILLIDNSCFTDISGQVLLNCHPTSKIFVSNCFIDVKTFVIYGLNVFPSENKQQFDKFHVCLLDIKCPTIGRRNYHACYLNIMLVTPFILLIESNHS